MAFLSNIFIGKLPSIFFPSQKKKPQNYGAFSFKIGGGGGNRTRVRKPSDRTSTYIACVLNSPFQTPTGRISEGLSYGDSPLTL